MNHTCDERRITESPTMQQEAVMEEQDQEEVI